MFVVMIELFSVYKGKLFPYFLIYVLQMLQKLAI